MVDATEDDQIEQRPENLRTLKKSLKDCNVEEAMYFYVGPLGHNGRDLQEEILS